jgi:hypothetical protein
VEAAALKLGLGEVRVAGDDSGLGRDRGSALYMRATQLLAGLQQEQQGPGAVLISEGAGLQHRQALMRELCGFVREGLLKAAAGGAATGAGSGGGT